jgi:hypothetical protein
VLFLIGLTVQAQLPELPQGAPMKTYSFRAEAPADLERFQKACVAAGLLASVQDNTVFDPLGDVEVEFQSDATLDQLRGVFRALADGHVMLQTLRECPLSENSLERDYDLE